MDRRGVFFPEDDQKLAELFKTVADEGEKSLSDRIDELTSDAEEEPPRKITPEEHFSSPEFQKIAQEAAGRLAFVERLVFRESQGQKFRSKKFRSR